MRGFAVGVVGDGWRGRVGVESSFQRVWCLPKIGADRVRHAAVSYHDHNRALRAP